MCQAYVGRRWVNIIVRTRPNPVRQAGGDELGHGREDTDRSERGPGFTG